MIKFVGHRSANPVIGLGLSRENLRRLKDGQPIVVDMGALGLPPGEILIFYGNTEATMAKASSRLSTKTPLFMAQTHWKDKHMDKAALSVNAALPRWKCHKEVWGDKIVEARDWKFTDPPATHYQVSDTKDTGIRWILAGGVIIIVTTDLIARGNPTVGDYFVEYDDHYKSWSPAKAFEDGYSRL